MTEIYYNKKTPAKSFIAGLALTTLFAYILFNSAKTSALVVLLMLAFAFFTVLSGSYLFSKKKALGISFDNKGITVHPMYKIFKTRFYPWEDINEFIESKESGFKMIHISLKNLKKYIAQETNPIFSFMLEATRKKLDHPFGFSAVSYDISKKELLNLLNSELSKHNKPLNVDNQASDRV